MTGDLNDPSVPFRGDVILRLQTKATELVTASSTNRLKSILAVNVLRETGMKHI
jgi:hypothetical protein